MVVIGSRFLHLRCVIRSHPYTVYHFSSISDSETQSQSSITEVKATVHTAFRRPSTSGTQPPPKLASFDEIRRKLSVSSSHCPDVKPAARPSLNTVRENLRQLRANAPPAKIYGDLTSVARLGEGLMNQNAEPEFPMIGKEVLPSLFGNEKNMKPYEDGGGTTAMRTEFMKMYTYSQLGEKLKMLRPEKNKKGKWFSLNELNKRLVKLREMEEKQSHEIGGISIKELRDTLVQLTIADEEKAKKKKGQKLEFLANLGGTTDYMLSDPKVHLVERYFHSDNMSSSEKLKLELEKVRDEFKKSESDCGSARVQVAQLTTKIKHLSGVLHKKDKHSRRGLQAMVQRRKKLLKYLRQTDWDSYSLVMSKLGLRDSPDIKA